ncbi:MAG: MmcQ/YjbR family DNA-binding protein, partial [Candidatus Eremiobacteraeota bacterium]|nr:MmcQ/YjbR family DNA-binding protein [Candidatus Eremiobacteraeota bacterium]
MATWQDVRRIALDLPGTSEEQRHNGSSWIVDKRFFVWERPLRKSDLAVLGADAPHGPILGVRTADLEMKEAILATDPDIFFTIPHFDG